LGRLVLAVAVAAAAAVCVQGLAAPALAAQPRAKLEGELEPGLRAAIVAVIGETDRPIDNRFEARRRARDGVDAARAVLRSEGYYAALVEAEVGEGDTPTPVVHVTPGPRFLLHPAAISWVGAPPATADAAAAQAAIKLQPEAPGRAADIVAAEGRIVSSLAQQGYADAAAAPREVVVDHADRSVTPTFRISAGPLVRLDGIQLTSKGRTNPAWVERLAPWRSGQVYKPEMVAELERRLLDPGVFDQVTVSLAPAAQTTPEGLRPVVVGLAERKPRTIELGASYANVEGLGVDARWTRYNLLRRADTLALIGRASKIENRAEVSLSLPHWRKPAQTLTLDAQAYQEDTPAYNQRGMTVSANVRRRYGDTPIFGQPSYFTYGGSIDASRTDELTVGTLSSLGRDVITFATLAELYLDQSDDPLDPRRGWRINLRAEPTLLSGSSKLAFVRLQAQGTAYLPVPGGGRTVIAGRLHVGSITNGAVGQIPAPQRFYAGGGGSVRGFAYQGVGPRLADGTPEGGLSLAEASAEIRQRLNGRWGVVAFVDAGDIGVSQAPTFKNLAVGAGVGVRYNLSFAPIRVDVATPVARKRGAARVQIYVSIGQSF
jgi:translocation and assembly module TamA